MSHSHCHPILDWDQDLSSWLFPDWRHSHHTALRCARAEGPFKEAGLRGRTNILNPLKLFFSYLPKCMNFITECLRKIWFYGRKNVKRITKVVISSGTHDLGSRVTALHPRLLLSWEMVFQILLSPSLSVSLKDWVQRVLPWSRDDSLALWELVALYAKRNGAEVKDKPSTSESRE